MERLGDAERGATLDEIAAFEASLQRPLPSSYRLALSAAVGGRVRPSGFRTERGLRSGVRRFYSVARLWDARETYSDRIPNALLPIGCDEGGNQICLGIEEGVMGEVFFWDHNFEDPDEPWSAVSRIASSLEAFRASLT